MSGKYIYIAIYCFMLSAHSYQLNKTVCEGSLCLYLYESDNPRITWDHSRAACTEKDLEMLRIESSQIQTIVDKLLQDLPLNTQRQVWIGGRQSSNATWRYLNGTEFHRPVRDSGNSASDLNCVHVKLCKNANPEYEADNCDEKRSTSPVLCQYDKSETGECRPSEFQFGDKCYVKTPYNDSESNRTDWYSGQTYCSQSPIQGDIAYSYLDDNSSINSVLSLFIDNDGCAVLWLGVRRRIWFWRTVSDSDGQPINYFNWFNDSQIQTSYDNCIYVDRDNGNKWRTQSCNANLPYFICMKENDTSSSTTTSTTTEATRPTTATTKQTNTTGYSTAGATTTLTAAATNPNTATAIPTTESKGQQERSGNISAVISVSVVIILIVLGAVGLVVFFVRRKKKKKNPDKYVNERFHKSSANQTKCENPEYAELEENTTGHDDVIDPYGVTGGSEKPKKIKHSVAPSGDLYALPRQKENAEEVNNAEVKDENRNDVKYREAPSGDLYAVPEKKINKSKDDQLDGIKETSDDNVYSLAKGINE